MNETLIECEVKICATAGEADERDGRILRLPILPRRGEYLNLRGGVVLVNRVLHLIHDRPQVWCALTNEAYHE